MGKFLSVFLILAVSIFVISSIAASGDYLGNLSANPYDPDSSSNPFGYGSPFNPDSINNPFGTYGSPFSPESATNPFSTSAPKLYESQGIYRGRLSTNPFGAGSPYRFDSPTNPFGEGLEIHGGD